jgi:hypothetical protein
VLEGKCWSTPTYSGGRIFARSTKEAVCVELSQGRAAVPAVDSANPSLALRASAETR